MPRVSVIIPTFNRAAFVREAISSVLQQRFKDFELWVIDDGSTDETEHVVTAFCDPRLHYEAFLENRGVSFARNHGIRKAKGEYLAFLDSDDQWKTRKLDRQVASMDRHLECLLSHTEEIWFRNGRHLNQKKRHQKSGGRIFKKSLELCAIGMSTVMVRRSFFERFGFFDEGLPACEDYDLWLRCTHAIDVMFIPEPLTIKHGGHPDQLSRAYVGLDRFRIQAIVKLLEQGVLCQGDQEDAIKALMQKCRIYSQGCQKRGKMEESRICLELLQPFYVKKMGHMASKIF